MNFEKETEAIRLKNLESSLTQKKYIQWIFGALLVSIIIAFIMFKSSRREKRLNKKLEEKSNNLVISESNLRKINSNQKTLFSIVGHDLKGPISSLSELLKVMTDEDDNQIFRKKLLPKLKNYTKHVNFTLENLLNWGKIQIKGENIIPVKINILSITSNTVALYSELISKKNLTVKIDINNTISAWADKEDIKVVVRNMLSNAIKFTHANGKIWLKGKSNKHDIEFVVADNGIGMSLESQKLVCDLDSHYSTFGTNNEKGTGLGLMLCKEIIARNNGQILVHSSVNNGTVFTVILPKTVNESNT
ncbi:MAG: sensor histidine kinase [Maribacter sp.]